MAVLLSSAGKADRTCNGFPWFCFDGPCLQHGRATRCRSRWPAFLRACGVDAASSASLAALELLVLVDPLMAPTDLKLLAIELPDDLTTDILEALNVPSAVIKVERNVLLNPRHPEMRRRRIIRNEAFSFDPRLL